MCTTGPRFIKTLVHHRLFSQYILFKAASIQYVFLKESEVKSLYSRVAVNKLHHLQTFAINYFS